MQLRLPGGSRALAATLIFAAAGPWPAATQEQPASANGERFKVLVPILERMPDQRGNFGKDVAEELRKLITKMQRHEPVDRKEMQLAMKRFGLDENNMTCIQNMQLAVQMQAELVVCGRWSGGNGSFRLDSVQVISSKTQEAFKINLITTPNAKEGANQIFTQFDRWVTALSQLTFCSQYLTSNDWDRAITNCDEVLKVNPNSPRANMFKAFALYSKANAATPLDQAGMNQALELYKKVLETSSTPEQEALKMAGIIAARVGKQEDSRNYFRQYLELNPGDVVVRLAIAQEQAKAGDNEGALKVVEEGLKSDSTNADLLTWAGIYASQTAQKANEAKPGDPGKIAPEAQVLYASAANYYKKLFDSTNGEVEVAIIPQIIQVLVVLERAPEAVEIGRRAVANPKTNNASVLAAYGAALSNAGNNTEALKILDEAIAKGDTSVKNLRARKADIQLRSGELQTAVASFREAIRAGEAKPDEVSNMIFAVGYNQKSRPGDHVGFLAYIAAAEEFAQSPLEKSKLNYFSSFSHVALGRRIELKTVTDAKNALPHFQRAIRSLEEGEAYARSQNGAANYASTLKSVREFAAYLQGRIKDGK